MTTEEINAIAMQLREHVEAGEGNKFSVLIAGEVGAGDGCILGLNGDQINLIAGLAAAMSESPRLKGIVETALLAASMHEKIKNL